jgi:hypothetical protein
MMVPILQNYHSTPRNNTEERKSEDIYRFHASATLPLVYMEYGTSYAHQSSFTKKWKGKQKLQQPCRKWKPVPPSPNPLLLQTQFKITRFKKHNHLQGMGIRDQLIEIQLLPPPPPAPKKVLFYVMKFQKSVFGLYSKDFRSTKRSLSMTFPTNNVDALLVYHTHVTCPTTLRSPSHPP